MQKLIEQFANQEKNALQQHKDLTEKLKLIDPNLSESIISPPRKTQVSIETASQNLIDYCALFCDGMESSTAQKLIKDGQALMKAIYAENLARIQMIQTKKILLPSLGF